MKTAHKTMKKIVLKNRRRARVRSKVKGSSERPRFCVFRSNTGLYVQIIDDENKKTICAVNEKKIEKGDAGERKGKVAGAYFVGLEIAKLAKEKNITSVVFDRGGRKYHGRIKACADGARDGGLVF